MFFIHRSRPIMLIGLYLCGAVAIIRPTHGQEEHETEQPEVHVTIQLSDLQAELDAALERIRLLEERVASLEATLAGTSEPMDELPPVIETSPEETQVTTIDESIPHASPRALLAALIASYEESLGEDEIGLPGDPSHRAYLRKLHAWSAGAERKFRGNISWHVRALDSRTNGRNVTVTFAAIDPVTHVELGAPFDVSVPRTMTSRLAHLEAGSGLGVLILKGVLAPLINIDESRAEPGSFNNPPLIGPFAEFGIEINPTSIRPAVEEEETREAPTPNPAEKP